MTSVTHPGLEPQIADPSTGGRLVTTDGGLLPFRGASLDADARGGLARVVLRQRFVNDGAEPLQVTYQLALPARAAVGGYAFTIGDRRIVGEIDRREAARERFEEAIVEGRSAAILEQDRDDVFHQEIGNVPPGAEVTAEVSIDQPLDWLEDGAWAWRFPTVLAPRYMGAEGRVEDRDRVTVDVTEQPTGAAVTMALRIRDELPRGEPTSPSHAVRVVRDDEGLRVELADDGGAALDRDVVVVWPAAGRDAGVSIDVARSAPDRPLAASSFGLLTLTPPRTARDEAATPRDLILLLDTSGSMTGPPLDAAREIVLRVIDGLNAKDRLEMIEFSTRPRRWKKAAVRATAAMKTQARAWVGDLEASGATEMHEAIVAALAPLRDGAQRQVVLVTDGLVGFEQEIVGAVRRGLPARCRVHTVGVGSAPNRSLTTALARVGRGGEVFVGLDDDPRDAARRLAARVSAPLVTDVELAGDALLEIAGLPDDLAAGAPSLVPVRVRPEGGTIVARGTTAEGPWSQSVTVPACEEGTGNEAIVRLFGRSAVADLEVARTVGESVDDRIEAIGLAHGISTSRTSWIAVSEEQDVDPRKPVRRVRVPQALPYGMSVEGLGLRDAAPMAQYIGHARFSMAEEERDDVSTMMFDIAPDFMQSRARGPISGRIVLFEDDRLVIEFECPRTLDWNPEDAHVVATDGEETNVPIDDAATSEPGRWARGLQIRLVLLGVSMPRSRLRRVRVVSGGRSLMIELQ